MVDDQTIAQSRVVPRVSTRFPVRKETELEHPLLGDLSHRLPGGAEIGAGVDVIRALGQRSAYAGEHGEPEIGVDIDLADAVADSALDLVDRYTEGRMQRSTVPVDAFDQPGRDR
jgi:hypothetical protein